MTGARVKKGGKPVRVSTKKRGVYSTSQFAYQTHYISNLSNPLDNLSDSFITTATEWQFVQWNKFTAIMQNWNAVDVFEGLPLHMLHTAYLGENRETYMPCAHDSEFLVNMRPVRQVHPDKVYCLRCLQKCIQHLGKPWMLRYRRWFIAVESNQ